MKIKQKKGISLIVLVITILVMIILATAVILTLQDSEILPGANEAKESSDMATLKEAANTAYSSWQIAKARKKTDKTAEEYVMEALQKQGLDTEYVMVKDDKLLVGAGVKLEKLNEKMKQNGEELIGKEVVGYEVAGGKEYTTDGVASNGEKKTLESISSDELKWQYIGVDENGNMLIAQKPQSGAAPDTSIVKLRGAKGWTEGPELLNKICDNLYSTEKGTARSMTIEDVTKILDYKGEKGAYYDAGGAYVPTPEKIYTIGELEETLGRSLSTTNRKTPTSNGKIDDNFGNILSDYYKIEKTTSASDYNIGRNNVIYPPNGGATYWLASRCVYAYFNNSFARFNVRYVSNSLVNAYYVFYSNGNTSEGSYALRPVVTLNSNIQAEFKDDKIVLK